MPQKVLVTKGNARPLLKNRHLLSLQRRCEQGRWVLHTDIQSGSAATRAQTGLVLVRGIDHSSRSDM